MITFPAPFVALEQYPGYFWNTNDQQLYTMKITGVLRPMKMTKGSMWVNNNKPGYMISHQGRKLYIWLQDLKNLKMVDSVIPVHVDKPKIKQQIHPREFVNPYILNYYHR